jgi:hypothetical protein
MNKAFGDLELNKEIDLDTIIYKRIDRRQLSA